MQLKMSSNLCNMVSSTISADRIYNFATSSVPPNDATVVDTLINNVFYFKPILSGPGVVVDETTNPGAVTISASGASNTYSTIPDPSVDATVVATQVGQDFQFRGFNNGTNMIMDQTTNPNVITVNGPTLVSTSVGGVNIINPQIGNQFITRQLISGTDIALDQATTPGGIIINSVPTNINASIFVDSVFGNNATGQRLIFNRPFQTITAALSAALSGDTIFVRPGTYAANVTLANNVNLVFQSGAVMNGTITATGAVTSDIVSDSSLSGQINIQNHSGLLRIATKSLTAPIVATGSSSTVQLQAENITTGTLLNISTSPNLNIGIIADKITITGQLCTANNYASIAITASQITIAATASLQNYINLTAPSTNTRSEFYLKSDLVTCTSAFFSNIFLSTNDQSTGTTQSGMMVDINIKKLSTDNRMVSATSSKTPAVSFPANYYPNIYITIDELFTSNVTGVSGIYTIAQTNLFITVRNYEYNYTTLVTAQVINLSQSYMYAEINNLFPSDPATQLITNFAVSGTTSRLDWYGSTLSVVGTINSGVSSSLGIICKNLSVAGQLSITSIGTNAFMGINVLETLTVNSGSSISISNLSTTGVMRISARNITTITGATIINLSSTGITTVNASTIVFSGSALYSILVNGELYITCETISNPMCTFSGRVVSINADLCSTTGPLVSRLLRYISTTAGAIANYNIKVCQPTAALIESVLASVGTINVNIGSLTTGSRIYETATGATTELNLNIGKLVSTQQAVDVISNTTSSEMTIQGTDWDISVASNNFIISQAGSAYVDVKNVIFSASGTGSFIRSLVSIYARVGQLTSTSTTSNGIFNTVSGFSVYNVDYLTSGTRGYRIATGTMLINTIKSICTSSLPVVYATDASTIEMTGSYTSAGINAVLMDTNTVVLSVIGCKLSSTSECIAKSVVGLVDVFSSGSIGTVNVNVLRITIRGNLQIFAGLPI